MTDNAILALLGGLLVVAGLITANWFDGKPYRDFINNPKVELYCQFVDGERQVPRSKITDFYDGVWYFDNGSATRCEVRQ